MVYKMVRYLLIILEHNISIYFIFKIENTVAWLVATVYSLSLVNYLYNSF